MPERRLPGFYNFTILDGIHFESEACSIIQHVVAHGYTEELARVGIGRSWKSLMNDVLRLHL